jgi:hypothetical protein
VCRGRSLVGRVGYRAANVILLLVSGAAMARSRSPVAGRVRGGRVRRARSRPRAGERVARSWAAWADPRAGTAARLRELCKVGIPPSAVIAGIAIAVGAARAHDVVILAEAATFALIARLPSSQPAQTAGIGKARPPAWAVGQRRLFRPEIRTRRRPCTGEYQGVFTIGNAGARALGPPLLHYLRLGLGRACWIIVALILFAPGLATSIAAPPLAYATTP